MPSRRYASKKLWWDVVIIDIIVIQYFFSWLKYLLGIAFRNKVPTVFMFTIAVSAIACVGQVGKALGKYDFVVILTSDAGSGGSHRVDGD